MSASVLVTGVLFKAPARKLTKSLRPYISATLKVKDGDSAQFWRVMAFSESAQADLERLGDGETLSAQGALRAEVYTPAGGEPRVSLAVFADAILPLRRPRTRSKPTAAPTQSNDRRAPSLVPSRADYSDDIPF